MPEKEGPRLFSQEEAQKIFGKEDKKIDSTESALEDVKKATRESILEDSMKGGSEILTMDEMVKRQSGLLPSKKEPSESEKAVKEALQIGEESMREEEELNKTLQTGEAEITENATPAMEKGSVEIAPEYEKELEAEKKNEVQEALEETRQAVAESMREEEEAKRIEAERYAKLTPDERIKEQSIENIHKQAEKLPRDPEELEQLRYETMQQYAKERIQREAKDRERIEAEKRLAQLGIQQKRIGFPVVQKGNNNETKPALPVIQNDRETKPALPVIPLKPKPFETPTQKAVRESLEVAEKSALEQTNQKKWEELRKKDQEQREKEELNKTLQTGEAEITENATPAMEKGSVEIAPEYEKELEAEKKKEVQEAIEETRQAVAESIAEDKNKQQVPELNELITSKTQTSEAEITENATPATENQKVIISKELQDKPSDKWEAMVQKMDRDELPKEVAKGEAKLQKQEEKLESGKWGSLAKDDSRLETKAKAGEQVYAQREEAEKAKQEKYLEKGKWAKTEAQIDKPKKRGFFAKLFGLGKEGKKMGKDWKNLEQELDEKK